MLSAVSEGGIQMMDEVVGGMEVVKNEKGNPHTQSLLGFLVRIGHMREMNKAKAFLYPHFRFNGGNMQSKMALAYTYSCMIRLYAVLVEVVVNSFLISKDSLVIEPAKEYFEKAADNKVPGGHHNIGVMYRK
ncbi:ERAD-associated E3 ubiquitin-protein ligase component HRD3A [Linum perenne]